MLILIQTCYFDLCLFHFVKLATLVVKLATLVVKLAIRPSSPTPFSFSHFVLYAYSNFLF